MQVNVVEDTYYTLTLLSHRHLSVTYIHKDNGIKRAEIW